MVASPSWSGRPMSSSSAARRGFKERQARVALKTLRIADATSLLRLKNEFRSLQDLHHPNLGLEHSERALRVMREQCTGLVWELDTATTFLVFCLAYLGEMAELCRRVPAALHEALERGDLYL